MLFRLFRKARRATSPTPRKAAALPPRLERLEDRLCLSAPPAGAPALTAPDAATQARFVADYGLTPYDAGVLVASKAAAGYFEEAAAAARDVEPKLVANWLANDLLGRLSERGEDLETTRITPQELGALVRRRVVNPSVSGYDEKFAKAEAAEQAFYDAAANVLEASAKHKSG